MNSLFNKYEMYNEKGVELSQEVRPFIKEIIEKWKSLGYKSTEIINIINEETSIIDVEIRLLNAFKIRKTERNNV